jgi:hypothetical protein
MTSSGMKKRSKRKHQQDKRKQQNKQYGIAAVGAMLAEVFGNQLGS